MSSKATVVGFAGTGQTGRLLLARLASTYAVRPFDIATSGGNAEPEAMGVESAARVAELAECPVSISFMDTDKRTRELLLAPDGLFAAARPGHLHVAMGALTHESLATLEEAGKTRGISVVDAPIVGSVLPGDGLVALVGADEECLRRVRPLLTQMTSSHIHVGPVGRGLSALLAINVVTGLLNQGVAEALALADATGLDRGRFYDALELSAVASYVHTRRAAFLTPSHASALLPMRAVAGDLARAIEIAGAVGQNLPSVRTLLEAIASCPDQTTDIASILAVLRGRDLVSALGLQINGLDYSTA